MDKDAKRLNKLVKKTGSLLGERPDLLELVVERCKNNKGRAIMSNASHPLHNILKGQEKQAYGHVPFVALQQYSFSEHFYSLHH